MNDTRLRRLAELADRQELLELVRAYSQLLDRQDFDAMRALFTEDSVNVHGGDEELSTDEFIELVTHNREFAHTTHYAVQGVFEIDGDEATGETYKVSYNRSGLPEDHESLWGSRSYEQFRRVDGVWKFSRRTIALDWTEPEG